MAYESVKCSNTILKENNLDDNVKSLHSLSLSTYYQSDGEELDHNQGIEDQSLKVVSKKDNDNDSLTGKDESMDYSEILSNLDHKAKMLDSGTQMCDSLNEIFSDLCNIEYNYVERLRLLKDKVDLKPVIGSIGTVSVLSSFKSYITKMAENHSEFLDSVSCECFLESKTQEMYQITKEINRLRKELDSYESDRVRHLARMKESYFKAKNAVSLCLDATHQAPSIKTSVHKTVIPVILNFIEVNNVVHKYDEFNYFMDFNRRLDLVIDSLTELEMKRSHQINDLISKFMIYETAKVRNLQYDLNSLIEALNNFNKFQGSEDNRKTLKPKVPQNEPIKHPRFDNSSLNEVSNNLFPLTSIQPPPYRVISKIQMNIEKFMEFLWVDDKIPPMNEFSGDIQSSLVRQIFCDLLSKSSSSYSELKSNEKFQILIDMVNAVLLVSQRQSDYWCGYSIIKLSDKYYTHKTEPDSERCYLWEKISNNEYWKNKVFWEECLIIVLSLDLKALFETSSCMEGSLGQINCTPSTEDAISFHTWMKKYGIPPNESEELIHRVCKKLKVPQSYINSLFYRN